MNRQVDFIRFACRSSPWWLFSSKWRTTLASSFFDRRSFRHFSDIWMTFFLGAYIKLHIIWVHGWRFPKLAWRKRAIVSVWRQGVNFYLDFDASREMDTLNFSETELREKFRNDIISHDSVSVEISSRGERVKFILSYFKHFNLMCIHNLFECNKKA